MRISDKYRFYLILIGEFFIAPLLIPYNYYKWRFGKCKKTFINNKERKPVASDKISVSIHEWGGYDSVRRKKINKIMEFECGLKFQQQRFGRYSGNRNLDICITISNPELLSYSLNADKIIHVPNEGMDFAGYSGFFERIKDEDNQYIILTNSSVNSRQIDFIDEYIAYMEANPSVGLLGISYNTKRHQTLIRNNFNPHIQSFFILTTLDVLKEIVKKNGGFPGLGITHKLLLIRNGEIRFSNLALELGYDLACILDNGIVYKFNKSFKSDNGRNSWEIPKGDYRLHTLTPNAINFIKTNG
jgi:hypothetical protein